MNDGEWELLSIPSRYWQIHQDNIKYAHIQFNVSALLSLSYACIAFITKERFKYVKVKKKKTDTSTAGNSYIMVSNGVILWICNSSVTSEPVTAL